MGESSPLRAGVVGAGAGGGLSIAALARSARFDLVAVADTGPAALARVAADHPGVALFASAAEMFAEAELDVVCVSTYAPTHLPIAARRWSAASAACSWRSRSGPPRPRAGRCSTSRPRGACRWWCRTA